MTLRFYPRANFFCFVFFLISSRHGNFLPFLCVISVEETMQCESVLQAEVHSVTIIVILIGEFYVAKLWYLLNEVNVSS